MVFYFLSQTEEGAKHILYMGRDKMENEELIKYGFPNDIWFHVDSLSSAHVYIRPPLDSDISYDKLPESVLTDCAQLVKANSIEGNKINNVRIVYTPWKNLRKTKGMVDGQVGFHREKECRYTTVIKKDNAIINRLNKTRKEMPTATIRQNREKFDKMMRKRAKEEKMKKKARDKKEKEEKARLAEEMSYDRVMTEENMTSNADLDGMGFEDYEDDFM